MIYRGTRIWLKDNSGIVSVRCIQFYPTSVKCGSIGNIALASLYKYKKLKKALKKKTYFILITTIKKKLFRKTGHYFFKFFANTALLLNQDKDKFIGTVYNVPITKELKTNSSIRLFRLSKILL